MADVRSTMAMQTGEIAVTDDVEVQYEHEVDKVAEVLTEVVREAYDAPLSAVLKEVHRQVDVNPAIVREALVQLLYSGVIQLTEDRRLVQG